MRAKPSSNTRAGKSNRANGKPHSGNPKGMIKKNKEPEKKVIPDLSVLRQPVDTSVCGLKQAVKVFETGTPEVLHLLTYDCDVVYECKVCRNLFRSLANFISHKRVYCTVRYSRAHDLQRSNKQTEDCTLILSEDTTEKLPTRITARKDLTSIVEALGGPAGEKIGDKKSTTLHLEPIDNTSYGVFQTVLKPDDQNLMRSQVTELHNLMSQNEVILGPDGRILENGFSDHHEDKEVDDEHELVCSICHTKFANRKTLSKHKRLMHESVRTCYSCPCCKNYFANPWSVYRHLYKVHRKSNEQVRRLRAQIHKKDVRVEKPEVNNVSNKKVVSPSKKKAEMEQRQRIQQSNKEWMDHLEDDWELQRCGGCGRKFERKAALISHSQICQKRIAACNRIDQNHLGPAVTTVVTPVVALSPLPCSKKPVPKPSPEKKIGIQVRMNYCKNSSLSQPSSRQQRSILGDDSDMEATSVDGKEPFLQQGPTKNTVDLKENSVLEEFFKNANKCHASEGVEKVNSYLSNRGEKMHTYEISTCKRSTFLRSNVGKNKNLEAKCLQLRSALENGISESFKNGGKEKDLENPVYIDGNLDNTSESNTSAISSLSSQLTPLVDKGYVCEVEQSIEIKNINISRTLEKIPSTEADSTSMTNGSGLHMTYNSRTYTGNIKFSPNGDATCEEVSTSVTSDEIPQADSNLQVDSSCLNDDEVSIDLKPVTFQHDSKNFIQESELENTISILTRNQLKAICKDDLLPNGNDKNNCAGNKSNAKEIDVNIEAITRELIKKKLHKYVDSRNSKCRICKKTFKKAHDVYRHVRTHTMLKRYECVFNGCKFQTFAKKVCIDHATTHVKESSGGSSEALVRMIDQSRWNLRLQKSAHTSQTKTVVRRELAPRNIVKTVNKVTKKSIKPVVSEKRILKSNTKVQTGTKKTKISKLLKKVATKQKLLTDFKHFKELTNINGKTFSRTKRMNKDNLKSPKRKTAENVTMLKKIKSSPLQNGFPVKVNSPSGKLVVKKQRSVSTNPPTEQPKSKMVVVKKELEAEEIIVNHITVDTDASLAKGRGSRTSSRKSSASSVDQTKGKSQDPPVSYESQSSDSIQNPEIVDSSSLEEEESQESDKPVDESHLKKIFMEVIFGPPPTPPVQPAGRPVRNKTRPKRDSDFILGSQKDIDRDNVDGKTSSSKKTARSPDSKPSPEISRKSK